MLMFTFLSKTTQDGGHSSHDSVYIGSDLPVVTF
jgi:hypothetical protein